jgi:hypothetical protein
VEHPLRIGWDEPGGTYDRVPPGPVPPPDPSAPAGELGFTFDRSGYRVPAIIVSPWVEAGSVYNEEHRHTSLIATLRKRWGPGDAFTRRDAAARTFDHAFSLETPRDPITWAVMKALPVPDWTMDPEVVGKALSSLGKGLVPAIIATAGEMGVPLPAEVDASGGDLPPSQVVPSSEPLSAGTDCSRIGRPSVVRRRFEVVAGKDRAGPTATNAQQAQAGHHDDRNYDCGVKADIAGEQPESGRTGDDDGEEPGPSCMMTARLPVSMSSSAPPKVAVMMPSGMAAGAGAL